MQKLYADPEKFIADPDPVNIYKNCERHEAFAFVIFFFLVD